MEYACLVIEKRAHTHHMDFELDVLNHPRTCLCLSEIAPLAIQRNICASIEKKKYRNPMKSTHYLNRDQQRSACSGKMSFKFCAL